MSSKSEDGDIFRTECSAKKHNKTRDPSVDGNRRLRALY